MEDIALQENTLALITKAATNFKKSPKARLTNSYIKIRMQTLDEHWAMFRATHSKILRTATSDERKNHNYFVMDMFASGEEEYITAKSEMADMLDMCQEKEHHTIKQHEVQDVQLPKINMPQFAGNYHDWGSFRDLYKSLIHENKALSNVQKLHYLKSTVTGEAEQLLKHIQITDKNYEVAYNILNQRYNNRRIIVNAILNRFLSQKKLNYETAKGIKELLDITTECLNNLKNHDVNIENWDPILIHLIVNKLDQESHKLWEEELNGLPVEELPTIPKLTHFLEGRFRVLEIVQTSQPRTKNTIISKSFHASTAQGNIQCAYCKEDHLIFNCKEFAKLEPEKRSEYVKMQRLCYNCLWPGHSVKYCKHNTTCRRCKRKHHSLLHSTQPNNEVKHTVTTSTEEQKTLQPQSILSHVSTQGHGALLATALVNIQTGRGIHTFRALLDPCSQETFISEAAVHKLQLRRKLVQGQVTGVGQMTSSIKHAVEVEVLSRVDNNFKIKCRAYVIKHVTDIMPVREINHKHWTQFENLTLADPTYHRPGQIDLLLGVKVYTDVIMNGMVKSNPGTPIAQQTHLGWVLSGGIPDEEHGSQGNIVSMHLNVSLDHMLQRFWEIETLDTNKKTTLTLLEKRAEEIYERTLDREADGRYIVGLPFSRDTPVLPEHSKEIAKKRLKGLERKLGNNHKLREEYNQVLREAITLKHMELIDKDKEDKIGIYLPHHAVVREDKETTKVRVVYDASCKGSNGTSLNDELLVGPDLQEELRDLIMRWRTYRICFVADIVKMYKQIKLQKTDTDYQRIVWRFSDQEEIKDYRLLTVTFGTACAPYLAIRTLRQLAKDEGARYPLAANLVNKDFYMDDILSGGDTEDQAIELQNQLTEMLRQGQFELQKWSSNSKTFIEKIEPERRANATELEMGRESCIKTLGIIWEVNDDKLKVAQRNTDSHKNEVITKRNVLSQIASLFDPMGWLAPTIVIAKIFMQKLWLRKLEWDEEMPEDLKQDWIRYKNELSSLSEIKIDRWMGSSNDAIVELHGFSDASQTAYAAAVYARVIQKTGKINTSLIMAKTKVAPVKTLSLPRLELCAAALLCKLLNKVMKTLDLELKRTYAWTDAKVVLAWIKGDPNRWTPFVKNRVIEIRNTLDIHWLYVNTKENPADPASRGVTPSNLKSCELWWRGPEFLQKTDLILPSDHIPETNIEKRTSVKCAATNLNTIDTDERLIWLQKYSSLEKLLDVVAFCRRWLKILKKEKSLPAHITCEEREEALTICIKMAQEIEFQDEISNLQRKKSIKRSSRLLPLNPYLDEKGVLRVGGRLKHADMEAIRKHPIILTKDNALIPVLLDEAHKRTLHGGSQLMTSYLRSRYWIIKGGQTIKRFYRKCQICTRLNANTSHQQMGNLPEARVRPSRPFLISGVDFAGPILCRMSKGRGAKAYKSYICLFVCMATKAIHLELVSDMTSQAFIAAFKRFVARRGHCQEIWSDHGTTFIAAEKELLQMWKQGRNELPEELRKLLDERGTRWKYIPPGAPNFGGLWEAGVKSTKYHLKRIIGVATLTFEELYTLLTQIEACLNSRPLAPLGDDLDVLTPGHFLIGEPVVSIPDRINEQTNMASLTRWQLMQRMLQDFWKKWQSEYLSRLQERPKWRCVQKELEIGDLVLIKDTRLPPANWRLGRILNKYAGSNGLTRTYDVRTSSGILQRSISNLCHLPN